MNCEEASREMTDSLAGELPAECSAALKAHLKECPACSRSFALLQRDWERIRNAFRREKEVEAGTTLPSLSSERRERIFREERKMEEEEHSGTSSDSEEKNHNRNPEDALKKFSPDSFSLQSGKSGEFRRMFFRVAALLFLASFLGIVILPIWKKEKESSRGKVDLLPFVVPESTEEEKKDSALLTLSHDLPPEKIPSSPHHAAGRMMSGASSPAVPSVLPEERGSSVALSITPSLPMGKMEKEKSLMPARENAVKNQNVQGEKILAPSSSPATPAFRSENSSSSPSLRVSPVSSTLSPPVKEQEPVLERKRKTEHRAAAASPPEKNSLPDDTELRMRGICTGNESQFTSGRTSHQKDRKDQTTDSIDPMALMDQTDQIRELPSADAVRSDGRMETSHPDSGSGQAPSASSVLGENTVSPSDPLSQAEEQACGQKKTAPGNGFPVPDLLFLAGKSKSAEGGCFELSFCVFRSPLDPREYVIMALLLPGMQGGNRLRNLDFELRLQEENLEKTVEFVQEGEKSGIGKMQTVFFRLLPEQQERGGEKGRGNSSSSFEGKDLLLGELRVSVNSRKLHAIYLRSGDLLKDFSRLSPRVRLAFLSAAGYGRTEWERRQLCAMAAELLKDPSFAEDPLLKSHLEALSAFSSSREREDR